MTWRKSRRCESSMCAEVKFTDTGRILVRDGRGEDSPILRFTPEEWRAFCDGVRAGEFDQP